LLVLPHRISKNLVSSYAALDFFPHPTIAGLHVRLASSIIPPSAVFPHPLQKFVILLVSTSPFPTPVPIQIQLDESCTFHLGEDAPSMVRRWIDMKEMVEQSRNIRKLQQPDLTLLEHPYSSSSTLPSSLSAFSSFVPSALNWHPTVACYTSDIELRGLDELQAEAAGVDARQPEVESDNERNNEIEGEHKQQWEDEERKQSGEPAQQTSSGKDDQLMVDEHKQQAEAESPHTALSFDELLDLELECDSDEEEREAGEERPLEHSIPFYGLLPIRCSIAGCHCTPLPCGRFFHRCAQQDISGAHSKTRRKQAQARHTGARRDAQAIATQPLRPKTPTIQASVTCRGIVLFALPHGVSIAIGGASYAPSPFHRDGIWCSRAQLEEERQARIKLLTTLNSQSRQRIRTEHDGERKESSPPDTDQQRKVESVASDPDSQSTDVTS